MKFSSRVAAAAYCGGNYQGRISSLAESIKPRVLVQTHGSGNYGESGVASFYTIDKLPLILENECPKTTMTPTSSDTTTTTTTSMKEKKLERVDIEGLGPNRLAFTIDDVLTNEEADALAACAESILETNGHTRVAPGIHTPPGMRINEAAHWYPSQNSTLLQTIYNRIKSLVPQTLDDGTLPLYPKLSEKVAQFKYLRGDRFNRHIDGLFPGQGINTNGNGVEEWVGVVSGLSLLFYLNDYEQDGLVGGETRLWSADGQHYVDVTPRKGRVLAFRRGSPNAVLHAGLEVTSDVPKYMALINLAYGEQIGTRPLM